jgi:hypothetical protein
MKTTRFRQAVEAWLNGNPAVESAVLFGSAACEEKRSASAASRWADLDLHVVTAVPLQFEVIAWAKALPKAKFCHQAVRPATGGVRKVTAIFDAGQVDLVIVPVAVITQGVEALRSGRYRESKPIEIGLNEMATCLHTGYRFIKGEEKWGPAYEQVSRLPGVRLGEREIRDLADGFLCDLLWVLQKLERGEATAAQHILHTKLSDTNLRLWRERQRQRGAPLPSFGLGRRLETLADSADFTRLQVKARPVKAELNRAAKKSFAALQALMKDLIPDWSTPAPMVRLLAGWLK